MESYSLEIKGRNEGLLLQNKTFVPLNGPYFSVKNSFHNKPISFLHASWNQSGTKIAAGDTLGNIYVFHLQKNRFSSIQHPNTLKACCTFITFTKDRTQDILVAFSDCSIISFNSETKKQRNCLSVHSSCVVHISFDKSGYTALSCSKDHAILWNLKTFEVIRVLTLKKDAVFIKAFFLPNKNIIVLAFNDDSVFLWSFDTFKCLSQFICIAQEDYLNIKSIDTSWDENVLACAGRASWFYVWSVCNAEKICTIALPEDTSVVKQVNFLRSPPDQTTNYVLSVLSGDGEILVYNISTLELLHRLLSKAGKITSFVNSFSEHKTVAISFQGIIEVYDLEAFLSNNDDSTKLPRPLKKVIIKTKVKPTKQKSEDVDKQKLIAIVRKFGEFPEKHRFFIWSQLLELPRNVDAFKILNQDSLKMRPLVKEYSFMNPGVRKTFMCLTSLIFCWHPVMQEMEYFKCLLFPFIKVLHKNPITCFEILVTIISNWCQHWFLFSPFQPFNILCIVENILLQHDKELMVHFMKYKIPSEVYAWSLLKTSFSEVFNKKEWLRLWDNIFSNHLSFQMFVVAAFNIVMRNVLLRCKMLDQFKECYRRHGISASVLLKTAYELQEIAPKEISPDELMGTFAPIPSGTYPTFFQMSQMKLDFETLKKKRIIDKEIHFLKQREDTLEIRGNYLKELQDLQILRRKLLLESLNLKDAKRLDELDKKLQSVQNIIQDTLRDQISMLKGTIGEDVFSQDQQDTQEKYFDFKDFVSKLKKKNR